MVRRNADLVVRVIALVGLAVSALLMAEYALPVAAGLCGPAGGCTTVRMCSLSHVGSVSWPQLGVAAYALVLALSLSNNATARRILPWAGLGAAVTGVTLLVLQRTVCHAFCRFCLVTDFSGIALGVATWIGRDEPPHPVDAAQRWVFGGLALASLLGAFAFFTFGGTEAEVHPEHVAQLPEPIAREQRPGVATIVEFADFECPFCRRQHEALTQVLASYDGRVRFVRKQLPLKTIHPHAEDAARAACCAEEQGHGDAMADALFHSEDLTPAGCESIASRLGLDLAVYRECLNAARTTEHLQRDHDAAVASGVQGLPTMYVGSERFEGAIPAETLRASIERALSSPAPQPPHT